MSAEALFKRKSREEKTDLYQASTNQAGSRTEKN